ncbi:hypothetical protein V5O48_014343 [Marasmius crinis-equi]|uniref:KOW domain-containing protein n=1 Tax=Marasmius crinis-equi TaxID=585013 RepID=A0ABR3EXY5_9AGAR
MVSLFVDVEAQVALSSDEEPDIDDEPGPHDDLESLHSMSDIAVLNPGTDVPFLEDLERRYTRASVSSRQPSSSRTATNNSSHSTILGKRKAVDVLESWHPALVFAAREPSPTLASTSTSGYHVNPRPIHPLTKQRLPAREEPLQIPKERRLLETDPNTVGMFGLWRQPPPTNAISKLGNVAGEKPQELESWSRWAKREGLNRGDVGQVWKAQSRQKTEDELQAEREGIQKAITQGMPPPDPSPEFVFESYWVLVVPRLPPPHFTQQSSLKLKPSVLEGRRRFPPTVFNPRKYDIIIPEKFIRTAQGFDIDGRLISHGLLIKLFKSNNLDPASTVPSEAIRAFQHHPHCQRFPFPIPGQWHFVDGEEVDVESSSNWECGRGVVKVSADGNTSVDYGAGGLHPAPTHLLCKVIEISDYVRVVSGDKIGKEGLVVERHANIIGISEKGSRQGIDIFVHVNSVTREAGKFDCTSIPWLDKEVTITKGLNYGREGIVKDVIRKPNRASLYLWLVLPQLKKMVKLPDTHVVAKGTREPLWKVLPLRQDQTHYDLDRRGSTSSGHVPWIGLYVAVIKGPHKGKEGTVQDVNRTQNTYAISRLTVTVEFNIMGSPCEHVYYDYVREQHTGLTLAGFHPLQANEQFFQPKPEFVGGGVKFEQRSSQFLSLECCIEREERESFGVDRSRVIDPADEGLEIPQLDPEAPMDCWNPYWEYPGSPHVEPPPPPPTSVSTQRPHNHDQYRYEEAGRHPLARPELVGVSLRVDILKGPHKKSSVYVKLTRTPTGAILGVLCKGKANHPHGIPLTSLAVSDRRVEPAKNDPLLVVIAGVHIGKLVRRISHFYVRAEKTGNDKWLVLAVVDKENTVDRLTGELVECFVDELAFVEESSTDTFRATHVTMKRVHDEARQNVSSDVRGPGTEKYDCLKAVITAQFAVDTTGP